MSVFPVFTNPLHSFGNWAGEYMTFIDFWLIYEILFLERYFLIHFFQLIEEGLWQSFRTSIRE